MRTSSTVRIIGLAIAAIGPRLTIASEPESALAELPLAGHLRVLGSSDRASSDEACRNLAAAPLADLIELARRNVDSADIRSRLRQRGTLPDDQVRLLVILLAYGRGDPADKVAPLQRMADELERAAGPGLCRNLDVVLSALTVCDAEAGSRRVRAILGSRSHGLEPRQKALRAINFALAQGLASKARWLDFLRSRLDLHYDLAPEILQIALDQGEPLTVVEVAGMATHDGLAAGSDDEFVCQLAIADYYWLRRDARWQAEFIAEVATRDETRLTGLRRRIGRRKGLAAMPSHNVGPEIHQSTDGATCYLGSLVNDK